MFHLFLLFHFSFLHLPQLFPWHFVIFIKILNWVSHRSSVAFPLLPYMCCNKCYPNNGHVLPKLIFIYGKAPVHLAPIVFAMLLRKFGQHLCSVLLLPDDSVWVNLRSVLVLKSSKFFPLSSFRCLSHATGHGLQ